jgi:hypothetical protein
MSTPRMPPTTDATIHLDPEEAAAARTLRRRARTAAGLTKLYTARADLDGVSPAAQMYAESVRWTV